MKSVVGPWRGAGAVAALRVGAVMIGFLLWWGVHWVAGVIAFLALSGAASSLSGPTHRVPANRVAKVMRDEHERLLRHLMQGSVVVASVRVKGPWFDEGVPMAPVAEAHLVLMPEQVVLYAASLFGKPAAELPTIAKTTLESVRSVEEVTTPGDWIAYLERVGAPKDDLNATLMSASVSRAPLWLIRTDQLDYSEYRRPPWDTILLVSPALGLGVGPDEASAFLSKFRDSVLAAGGNET